MLSSAAQSVYAYCLLPAYICQSKALKNDNLYQVNDTIMLDIETGKPKEFVKFELGNICMVTGGANNG